jgi:hypothetical protein
MDYHLFVLTITLVVYFIMKRYYSKKELSSNKKSGRLIYLLSVPFVMYLYKYFYLKPNDNIIAKNVTSLNTSTDVTSEPLLTELYPETSVNISSSSKSS